MVDHANDKGFRSEASEGCVLLAGAGVAVTLNPERALDVADEMIDAAAQAIGQRKMVEIGRDLKPI